MKGNVAILESALERKVLIFFFFFLKDDRYRIKLKIRNKTEEY